MHIGAEGKKKSTSGKCHTVSVWVVMFTAELDDTLRNVDVNQPVIVNLIVTITVVQGFSDTGLVCICLYIYGQKAWTMEGNKITPN